MILNQQNIDLKQEKSVGQLKANARLLIKKNFLLEGTGKVVCYCTLFIPSSCLATSNAISVMLMTSFPSLFLRQYRGECFSSQGNYRRYASISL